MKANPYIIALDIGSTSIKARSLNLDKPYQLPQSSRRNLRHINPENTQRDPYDIWEKSLSCLQEISTDRGAAPRAIGLCSFMHSLLLLDVSYKPISPVILWNELKSQSIAQGLEKSPLGKNLYQSTGTPVHAMSPLCKIAYLRQHNRELFARTAYFSDVKSWLLWQLTGDFILDWPSASATGLMDLDSHSWSPQALDFCGMEASQLPRLLPPSHIIPARLPELGPDCSIVPGLSDGGAANLGSGNVGPDTGLTLTMGTSGALRFTSNQKKADPEGILFHYILREGQYVIGGASNNCGNVIDWFKKTFLKEEYGFPLSPRQEDIFFLPWLHGERAPYKLYKPQACFWPLAEKHSLSELYQALILGILFNLGLIREKLEDLQKQPFPYVRLSGGLAQMKGLAALLAQVWQIPAYEMQEADASVVGTLGFMAQSLGLDTISIEKLNPVYQIHEPNSRSDSEYQLLFSRFKEISKVFSRIS